MESAIAGLNQLRRAEETRRWANVESGFFLNSTASLPSSRTRSAELGGGDGRVDGRADHDGDFATPCAHPTE